MKVSHTENQSEKDPLMDSNREDSIQIVAVRLSTRTKVRLGISLFNSV